MESVKVSCVILHSLSSFSVLHRLPEQRCSLRSEAEPNSCLVCLRRDACVLTLWLNLYLNCVCEPHNSSVVNYRKQTKRQASGQATENSGCKSDGSSRIDMISILISSDTIFADTSKNDMIRFGSIQEYISILWYYIHILNSHLHFY